MRTFTFSKLLNPLTQMLSKTTKDCFASLIISFFKGMAELQMVSNLRAFSRMYLSKNLISRFLSVFVDEHFQLFWVFDIEKQKRIVAKDGNEQYLSIPINFELLFQKVRRKDVERKC